MKTDHITQASIDRSRIEELEDIIRDKDRKYSFKDGVLFIDGEPFNASKHGFRDYYPEEKDNV